MTEQPHDEGKTPELSEDEKETEFKREPGKMPVYSDKQKAAMLDHLCDVIVSSKELPKIIHKLAHDVFEPKKEESPFNFTKKGSQSRP